MEFVAPPLATIITSSRAANCAGHHPKPGSNRRNGSLASISDFATLVPKSY